MDNICGSTTAGNDIVGQDLAVFARKTEIAAIGLHTGGGGVGIQGDGNIDIVLRTGIVGHLDGLAELPRFIPPGGFCFLCFIEYDKTDDGEDNYCAG